MYATLPWGAQSKQVALLLRDKGMQSATPGIAGSIAVQAQLRAMDALVKPSDLATGLALLLVFCCG